MPGHVHVRNILIASFISCLSVAVHISQRSNSKIKISEDDFCGEGCRRRLAQHSVLLWIRPWWMYLTIAFCDISRSSSPGVNLMETGKQSGNLKRNRNNVGFTLHWKAVLTHPAFFSLLGESCVNIYSFCFRLPKKPSLLWDELESIFHLKWCSFKHCMYKNKGTQKIARKSAKIFLGPTRNGFSTKWA